tara:strand:- start:1399 stop:1809 length:411 start_codon:yes stop_codon:yes gene_type:complete
MNKKNFFKEVNKFKGKKVELALNLEARDIMDGLYEFRQKISDLSSRNNEVMDEYSRVKQMFSDLANDGENALTDYNSLISRADSFKEEVSKTADDLGIGIENIPYYEELQNNISDTKEDEEAVIFWINNWGNLSND